MVQTKSQKAEISNTGGAPVLSSTLKADWLAALRSGEYQQAEGELCSSDGALCCIGVLGRVAGREITHMQDDFRQPYYSVVEVMLPEYRELASMNDRGKSFSEIADYIEANIPTTDNSVAEDRS